MIKPDEYEIVGGWIKSGDRIVGDKACERVHRFTEDGYLAKLGTDSSGWETLFRDPNDGRYWERTYPHSEMHGGGPPALLNLTETQARDRYPHLFENE
jgi:hypothetical protein